MAAFAVGFVAGMSTKAKAEEWQHGGPGPSTEYRNYWAMTCTPDDSPPYKVESIQDNWSPKLIVTSTRGRAHEYHVTKHITDYPGFHLYATDGTRTLHAYFSKEGGSLDIPVTGGHDDCGPLR
jgi:hypothetical protein